MATKKYDAAVKTGEYTDRNGEKKSRYENIGTVMMGDNGPYLILKRTFNPAGVPNPENRDSIVVSFFEPREADGSKPAAGRGDNFSTMPPRTSSPPPPASSAADDIPF